MTPLVFVHGFMGGSDQWHLQEPLGDQRALVRLDLPGFGRNVQRAPVNRIEGFAQFALNELTKRGVNRFDLLGHSMGGMIVQEMVRLAPDRVRRLVLYGTGAVGVLPGRFEPIETSMARARIDGPARTARRIAATWFLQREQAPEFAGCADIAELGSLDAILAGLEAMQAWSGLDYLSEIKAKTLIVWGDCDRTYAWQQIETLWRTIPNCSLAVVPRCAHAVHMENAFLFNQLVEEFLSEL